MEYTISLTEINRRKRAFTTLVVSILAGLILSSLDFIIANFLISGFLILITAAFLSLSRLLTIKTLDSFARTRFQIKKDHIERTTRNSKEKYKFKDIKQINIKKTTHDTIRDIRLFLRGRKAVFINGLANFNEFESSLLTKCPRTKIKRTKEPLDFDHPLFYIFFGLLISSAFTSFIRLIYCQSQTSLQITFVILLVYNTIISMFFIISKPLSKTFGKKKVLSDYLVGIILAFIVVCLGLYIFTR